MKRTAMERIYFKGKKVTNKKGQGSRTARREKCDGRYFRKIESKFCSFVEKNLSLWYDCYN